MRIICKYVAFAVSFIFSLSCSSCIDGGRLAKNEMNWLPENPPTARLKCDVEQGQRDRFL